MTTPRNEARPTVQRLDRTPTPIARVICGAVALVGIALLAWMALERPDMDLDGLVAEHGWLEWSQPWLWVVTGAVCALTCLTRRPRRDLLVAGWMTLLSLLAGLREMDLHAVLNPENIAMLGIASEHAVHFRIDWWLSSETSVGVRAVWAGVALAILAATLLPFAFARIPWFWLFSRRDAAVVALFLGAGLLVSGYVLDDFIERIFDMEGGLGEALEEGSEYAGQLGILAGSVLLLRASASDRAARLDWPGHWVKRRERLATQRAADTTGDTADS